MKKFEIPEINISLFDVNITADDSQTAVQKAQEALNGTPTSITTVNDWKINF